SCRSAIGLEVAIMTTDEVKVDGMGQVGAGKGEIAVCIRPGEVGKVLAVGADLLLLGPADSVRLRSILLATRFPGTHLEARLGVVHTGGSPGRAHTAPRIHGERPGVAERAGARGIDDRGRI